jgi:adenine phosphoribosyltransferase
MIARTPAEFVKSLIRTVPDFPKPGIQFRDVTTLLNDAEGFRQAVMELAKPYRQTGAHPIDKVAGIESRGFIIGAPVAIELGVGFVAIRKPGKLPGERIGRDYFLEYGSDRLELHAGAIQLGDRVLLVDDLIATGGTALAASSLIEAVGGIIAGCAFIVDLPDIGGRKRLEAAGRSVFALCAFEGE